MIYEYVCHQCKTSHTDIRAVKDRDEPVSCSCGGTMKRVYSRYGINAGDKGRIPGLCHTLDEKPIFVKSKHHFRELCKERGLRPVGLE